jgi:4'-phosphopantetheinyl transferase EntD
LIYLSFSPVQYHTPSQRASASFQAGRTAAHQALSLLGLKSSVTQGQDKLPQWPAGIIGSISHSEQLAGAAIAKSDTYSALGIDIEEDVEKATRVFQRISTDRERTTFISEQQSFSQSAFPQHLFPLLVFCAKESFFKAYNKLLPCSLSYEDISCAAPLSIPHTACTFDNLETPLWQGSSRITIEPQLQGHLKTDTLTLDVIRIDTNILMTLLCVKHHTL